ncbi:MAG: hypothetical protein JXX28_09235 [Deltaproteobacteria bacterium]|nr:hypothetical protein [Deltaproteobacteria bacterium]
MAEETTPFVAREEDLQTLSAYWQEAKAGKAQVIRLQAPFGGGRRALAGEFLRAASRTDEEAILWRVVCMDQENGLQWLIRMYGSLVATLNEDLLRRSRAEMSLNALLPAQPKRVQGWYQGFIESMKQAKTDKEKGAVQLRLPQDNPLIGLVEVVNGLAQRQPVLIDLQNANVVHSLALGQFLEALLTEARELGAKLMVILHDEPDDDVSKALTPVPLLDMFQRRADDLGVLAIAPWTEADTARYLESKGLTTANAARITEIAKGRPGFVAELTEILSATEQLDADLSEVSFSSLTPLTVKEGEIDAPTEPPVEGQRRPATTNDVAQVVYLAALLGQAFPSNLVADMGGFTRDSIDDLLDAMGDLFEEVQHTKELGWLYRFTRGSWREGVMERNDTEEGHELARRVGVFMERQLVPRGYGFISKTARVYAEHQAGARAALMRSIALTNDAPDMWGLAYDLTKYFDEITWPDPMKRTIFMNLAERIVGSGAIEVAERVLKDGTDWATAHEDRELAAYLLFAGSRLDTRRQDLYRARDRARDAIRLYEAMGNKGRTAEIYNHLAAIELQDGSPNAALELVNKAIESGLVEGADGKKVLPPQIFAHAEHIQGLVARRSNKLAEATTHFQRANEIAGAAGLGPLALDAGLQFGEALLAQREFEKARTILQQVLQIARSLQSPIRERGTCELLAQAEGALGNHEAATSFAARTLELSKALRFEQVIPLDLYNLGYFHYANKKPSEALTFFRQAEERVGQLGEHPVVKELYHFMGLSYLSVNQLDEAKDALRKGLRPAQKANDWPKMVVSLDALANIEQRQGRIQVASKLLTDAIGFAKKGNLRDARKDLKKKLDRLAH